MHLHRRQWLSWAGALLAPPLWAQGTPAAHSRLFAAWQQGDGQHQIGLLEAGEDAIRILHSLPVPTRAHGLWPEAGGDSVLAVARRPGDWLLRWAPASGRVQWHWTEADRRFNGHVIASPDGQQLWTTETDLDSAEGRLGVHAADTLERVGDWPTHGMDPHQLLTLPSALGPWPAGTLLVANGGIPTLPETGRTKRRLDRMDASLVALDPRNGQRLGQWRLADPYLSIRHLAWDPVSGHLGIALQAEHPDDRRRQQAPVLAIWDGSSLKPASAQPALQGYGGDVCAMPGGGFAVSCPRADALAIFDGQGRYRHTLPHGMAYALASKGGEWWCSGNTQALGHVASKTRALANPRPLGSAMVFDNHWRLGA